MSSWLTCTPRGTPSCREPDRPGHGRGIGHAAEPADWLKARLAGHTMCITFVTVGELAKWRALRDWGPQRVAGLARWRERVAVLQYDEAVAVKWGQLQARAQQRGRPRPQNDTWIAACCLVDDLPLAALNTKDFADFAEHDGLSLI